MRAVELEGVSSLITRADVEVGAKQAPVMVLLMSHIHGRGTMMKAAGVRGSHVSFQPSAVCQ